MLSLAGPYIAYIVIRMPSKMNFQKWPKRRKWFSSVHIFISHNSMDTKEKLTLRSVPY